MAEQQEVIRGTVERLYYAAENFCAGKLRTEPTLYGTVSFAGKITVRLGELIGLRGHWTKHPKYGDQFAADDVVFDDKPDKNGLATWLATHEAADGIGLVRAKRIAEQFGDNFTLALKLQPEAIARAAGVRLEQIEVLAAAWFKMEELNAIGAKLSAWGLSRRQIEVLHGELGNSILTILEEDPYVLCRRVKGFGFRTVDKIAQKLGVPKTHPGRVRAAVTYVLDEATDDGSTCLTKAELLTEAEKALILDELEAPDRIMTGVEELLNAKSVTTFGEGPRAYYALAGLHHAEVEILDWLDGGAGFNPHFHPEMLTPTIDAHCGELDGSQLEAAYKALGNRFSLMSGPAGSGKTYTVRAVVHAYEAAGKTIALCAPTGKAARRLEQVTKREAKTIHRLLEFGYRETEYRNKYGFDRNENNPLSVDVVIVDEHSMVDAMLAWHLAKAVSKKTAVLLVGDHNQLPPVGPGAMLRDCIAHEFIPVTVLRHCHRQAGPLKQNCSAILEGHVAPSEPEPGDGKPAPWYVHRKLKQPTEVLACLERLFTDILPNRWGFDPLRDVQFLTPIHKGELGTRAINLLLQRLYQRQLSVMVEPVGEKQRPKLYAGDKVINTRNNYTLDVMNGHQGVVKQVSPLIVEFDDGVVRAIEDENRGDIELAYCMTPHKAQGSEWPCIVTVCHRLHQFMLHRNWLYTATTRSKDVSVILGDEWAIEKAAKTVKENERKTYLDFSGRSERPSSISREKVPQ